MNIEEKKFKGAIEMKTATEITAIAIYKVTVKASGQQCYAVPSDSTPGTFYITCWNKSESRWTCTCKAGQFGHTCKHAKAAQVSILANKDAHDVQAREDARRQAETRAHMDELAADLDDCRFNPWHGSNRDGDSRPIDERGTLSSLNGFRLMR